MNENYYCNVDLYDYKSVNNLSAIIDEGKNLREMLPFDYNFLFGLINTIKPKKILEVGVAAGVTTAALLEFLQYEHMDSKLYSIDKSRYFYRDKEKSTGYYLTEIQKKYPSRIDHYLYTGGVLPSYIEEIGGDIDFVYLDTMHYMPGELLDFLTVLPYLSKNAIVCIHDVSLSHVQLIDQSAIATHILLDVTSGEKYYMEDPFYGGGLSNIAAIRITNETVNNIKDVFSALYIGWSYLPDDSDLEEYRLSFKKNWGGTMRCLIMLSFGRKGHICTKMH